MRPAPEPDDCTFHPDRQTLTDAQCSKLSYQDGWRSNFRGDYTAELATNESGLHGKKNTMRNLQRRRRRREQYVIVFGRNKYWNATRLFPVGRLVLFSMITCVHVLFMYYYVYMYINSIRKIFCGLKYDVLITSSAGYEQEPRIDISEPPFQLIKTLTEPL